MEANNKSFKTTPLLTSYTMGRFHLSHRIVLPPLTRNRSYNNIPQQHSIEYYAQRTTPGGLVISEAASACDISDQCPNFPGIWTKEQVEAWKPIVSAVHEKGGIFFCQIWHPGRLSNAALQKFDMIKREPVDNEKHNPKLEAIMSATQDPYKDETSSSPFGDKGASPCELSIEEISQVTRSFKVAARNAIEAGFDGVEILGANGYLIDQFMKDGANERNDRYGGSLENRCRFGLEVVEAVAEEIGADRVGVKLAPYDSYNFAGDSNPEKLGLYMARQLSNLGICYIHATEPRSEKIGERYVTPHVLQSMRSAFNGTFIASGGFDKSDGDKAVAEEYADLISFGRLFLANPDLPKRFEMNAPLNKHNRSTFYTCDPVIGYTDYPFLQVAS